MRKTVYFLFFLSGFAGLVYELVWLRLFSLTFGNTTQAGAVVLAAFMAGLSLGAWRLGKRADQTRRPLRLYAWLEFGIAASALLLLAGIFGADRIYAALFQWTGADAVVLSVARIVISFALMIVPCALMGGTLPVLARVLVRDFDQTGQKAGRLYAVNTIGAVCGVLFAGFFAVRTIGVYPTVFVAVGLNLLAGIGAWVLSQTEPETEPLPDTEPIRFKQLDRSERYGLVLAGAAGFFALALEVLYTRLILFTLNLTIYVWVIVLSVFLIGIASGAATFAGVSRKVKEPTAFAAHLLMWMAIGMWLSLIGIARFDLISGLYGAFATNMEWSQIVAFKFFAVGITLFAPAFLSGAAFPFFVQAIARHHKQPGRRVGIVYSVNTVFAIVGSLFAGFILLQVLGAQRGIFWAGIVLFGMAAYVAARLRPKSSTIAIPILIGVIVAIMAVVIPGKNTISDMLAASRAPGKVLMLAEEANATVIVYDTSFYREISINGITSAGTDPVMRTTQILQGHVPMMMHPDPKKVLMVGFGTGETADILSMYDPDRIDAVEICRAVFEAAPFFKTINRAVYGRPNFHATVADGRNFLRLTDQKFDVILNDSIHPTYLGNASLYTQDYFQDAADHLNKGGVMAGWIPLFDLTDDAFRMMVKSFVSVFPNSAILYAHTSINRHALLVAKKGAGPLFDPERMRRHMESPEILASLEAVGIDDPLDLINFTIMGSKGLNEYLKYAVVSTDMQPRLEFEAPRIAPGSSVWRRVLYYLLNHREDPIAYLDLTNVPDPDAFKSAHNNRNIAAGQVMLALASQDQQSVDAFGKRLLAAKQQSPGVAGVDSILSTLKDFAEKMKQLPQVEYGKRIAVAKTQMEIGNTDKAVELLNQALLDDPNNLTALGNLGLAYIKLEKPDQAIEMFDRIIMLNPENAQALQQLGVSYFMKSEYSEAAGWFAKAMKVAPPNVEMLVKLGMAQSQSGSLDQAEKTFRLALNEDKTYARAYFAYALLLAQTGRFLEARTNLTRAIALEPNNKDFHGSLGLIYLKEKEFALARDQFAEVLKIDPTDQRARQQYERLSGGQ